ncbi:DUF934 domain-containing protein [Actibacterium sp. MT2.3-13A]|uniref:DUF934 domain-containing protein n=1 Tax=Actibacterium sp. MT2.3-13A TaxID=2828332 RepID=UPI001BA6749C|nr:DUF934 domain-containing protein [Actibacterium sp. MT2.3-13A]
MSVIVTDKGFAPDGWNGPLFELSAEAGPQDLEAAAEAPMIRIHFAGFGDGRGFTLARRLRMLGYGGRLRAAGPLLADQYAMARRAGFDEVEIPDAIAARQPWDQWQARADWRAHDYQARLRGTA